MTGSSIDEKLCHPYNDTGWSFEQLSTGGIKSSDLAHWNAPVNIIDEYEHFLLTNNDELRLSRFCNCTGKMYFGTQCQYTFDVIDESFEALLSSHFANLQSITVDEAITMEDADVTCYKRDASCNGGCLDWRQICNGIADCNNGDDETSCGLLEYNECFMDEYRCRSGHCIPIMFAFDTTIDCADGSDEVELIYPFDRLAKCYRNIPNMFCDDHNDAWMMFPCGDGEIIDSPLFSCENQRHVRTLQQLYAGDVTLCWQYMICVQYLDFLFPLLVNCNDLCGESGDCLPTIPLACRDSTVIFPPKPVNVHPPVYFVYQTNMSERRFVPDFICYKQCDHLYPPSLKLHGYSCRSFTEFTGEPFHVLESFLKIFTSILHLFAGCINNIAVNHTSAIFHCPLTNRGISSHRIKDTFIDCHLSLDETFNGSTCALNLTQRFQCWTRSDECIPFRLVQDSAEQCSDHSDEVYPLTCDYGTEQACDYKRGLSQPTIPHYQFEDLCDGKESKSSLSWLLNGTDETDCEDAWCLLSPLTQCDGYWNCVDGRDELNCSLSSVSVGVKAALLVHNLSGCTMLEHFCLPVSSSSGNTLRPCLAVSRRGDGHIDCWGATDERCSFCNYTTISLEQHYRCAGDSNICIGWKKICNGHNDCPVGDDEKVCDWLPILVNESYFYCRNGTIIDRHDRQCNGRIDCENGEDEWFCDMRIPRSHDARLINFNEENYPVYPINLSNGIISHVHNIQIHRSVTSLVTSGWYCNRGFPIKNRGQRRCLCPPSYTGARCEIQRDRVSLFLQVISSASLQREIAIKLIVYLINVISLEILAEEEILHLPYIHSSYKHLASLSSIHANNAFVRIDAYEVNTQRIINYRTSFRFVLPFSFLPVRRLAVRLILPDDANSVSRIRFICHSCFHGDCLSYQNSDEVFCRCHNGWTGPSCNISFMCAPAAHSLSSHRCLCPMNRHGTRCFVPNSVQCQCQNNATCVPLDARTGQSACLCSNNFFGRHCERMHASLTVNLLDAYQPETLPIVLVQFFSVSKRLNLQNIHYENIFLFERIPTDRALVVRHVDYEELPLMVLCKVFYSASIDHYAYYLVLYMPDTKTKRKLYPKHVHTQLEPKQRCLHVREMEIFKSPVNILAYQHIKRIKFYLRACTSNLTRCFHDEVYLCFCPDENKRIPSCITYDHTRETCKEPSYCLNGGLCIENRRKGIVEFSCLCPACHYYGSLCQFSIGQQGISLDALVGVEIRTGRLLSEQSILIKLSMIILTSMIVIGFVGNTLATVTFARKKSRKAGCGWYLLVTSMSNQCTLVVFALRYIYLLVTQTVVWNNRTQSLILCQCLELGLAVLPNLSNWLSACVSVERTFTIARGALFNTSASVRTAKRLCIILPLIFTVMAIHEPMTRHLIEDPRLGRYTWCITKFNSETMKTFATVLSIVHLLGPFIINLFSTSLLIFTISRQKLTVRKDTMRKSFATVLFEQIAKYKHLIISPVVLLVLTLPRLVITLGSLCIDTSWRNYIFLAGYFISFIPFMATLLIFILPAPVYRNELKLFLSQFRSFFVHKSSRNVINKS